MLDSSASLILITHFRRAGNADILCIVKELQKYVGVRINNIYEVNSKKYCIKLDNKEKKMFIIVYSGQHIYIDDKKAINDELESILVSSYDYVFITGGLGPTHDDITAQSIAKAFKIKYGYHKQAYKILENYYGKKRFRFFKKRLENVNYNLNKCTYCKFIWQENSPKEKFSFDQANEAHALFASNKHIGKIILENT